MAPSQPLPKPPALIDMHAHFYGGGLVAHLEARASRPCLRPAPEGTGRQMLAMNGAFPFEPAHWDPEVGLARMDAAGIARRMLTFPGALCLDALPAPEIAPAIGAFNTFMADLGQQTGGRLIGLAGLPLADMDLASAELRRVRHVLKLPGAILPSDYFDSIANARQLAAVLEAANETGALLMLHPGPMAGQAPAPLAADFPQFRTSAVALQAQASQVVLTLVLSDLLDRFPRIRFQVINLGGTIPFVLERMQSIARHRTADTPFPTDRLRRLWYDTASMGPRAVEMAVALYGADRVMAGSDWPIFRDDPWSDALLPACLDSTARAMVAHGTADALLAEVAAALPREV